MTSPENYFKRTGQKYKRTGGASRAELTIQCPECGKPDKCYVNSKTWLWHCKVCEASGNEFTLKKSQGNIYDLGQTRTLPERPPDELEIAIMSSVAGTNQQTNVEQWAAALQNDPMAALAREYMLSRGFTMETLNDLLIGWIESPGDGYKPPTSKPLAEPARRRWSARPRPVQGESNTVEGEPLQQPTSTESPGWITIPAFHKHTNGKPDPSSLAIVKLRSVPPAEKEYKRIAGGESILFAPGGIDPDQTLVVVGGELDAIALYQQGWTNVVAGTTGEKGWSPAWTEQISSVEDVVIVYDNDSTGRGGAMALAKRLGSHRVRLGTWPEQYNDANDCLIGMGADQFDIFRIAQIVNDAKTAAAEGVSRVKGDLADAYKARLQGSDPRGISTGWQCLDDLIGGVRFGELTVITGDTGSGKTTFASDWARRMALPVTGRGESDRDAVGVLICPFEMGDLSQVDKLLRQQTTHPPSDLSPEQLDEALDQMGQMPLWILRQWGYVNIEALRNTIVYAARRLGVRFVLLDHLSFLVHEGSDREREQASSALMMCAELARAEDIHITLIVHPHSTGSGKDKDRDNRPIQLGDIKFTTSIKQLAYNVISVWRPRNATRDNAPGDQGRTSAVIYSMKARSDYSTEGAVSYDYWLRAARFEDQTTLLSKMYPGLKTPGQTEPKRKSWKD